MKKLQPCITLLLALMLLFSPAMAESVYDLLSSLMGNTASPEGVLVSEAPVLETPGPDPASLVVQDMYNYMQNRMTFDAIDVNGEGASFRKFQCSEEDYALVQAYVRTLCGDGQNFVLVDSYMKDYGNQMFFSYALDYTGTGRVTGKKMEMSFGNGSTGHIHIWGNSEYGRIRGYIYIAKGLEFGDLGLRVSGETETVSMPGESLDQPLYRLSNGSYRTGDGRFTVHPGEAVVYMDGTPYTTRASLVRNQAANREELRILNFYRNASILLTVPYNSVLTGDILDRRTIGLNEDRSYDPDGSDIEDLLHWTFSNKILGAVHNGAAQFLYWDKLNDVDDGVVRVMYWDEKADVAVFYICLTFDTAPYTYEAVAAVGMGGTPASTGADDVFTMSVSEDLPISFTAREYGATYELFTWEILEGSNLIELTGTRSSTCNVHAWDPGTVRIRVYYEYGTREPDILTGNMVPAQHSRTREYVINIAP